MVDLVRQMQSRQGDRPEVTAKSFVLQECEGIGRAAKVDYCRAHGHWVMSKQHDGIVAGATCGMSAEALRLQLERTTTAALGYHQHVTSKDIPTRIQRAKVPWERQWPYDTEFQRVEMTNTDRRERSQSAACLGRAQGPMQSQQWEGEVTLIMNESARGRGGIWVREFVIGRWEDAAVQRLHMDMQRGYVHVHPRIESNGARTGSGASTAWTKHQGHGDG